MIVMKFGGTSVKTASAMRLAAACVSSNLHRHPLVVVSACGGITNSLLQLARAAGNALSSEVEVLLNSIETHHRDLCEELIHNPELKEHAVTIVRDLIAELREYTSGILVLCECTDESLDKVASFGERLSSAIFSDYLRDVFIDSRVVDAATFMKTSADFTCAVVDLPATRSAAHEHIAPWLDTNCVIVTQGFIGSTSLDQTTTLGRGGSDVSAAILGAVLTAEEIQIWTDVSGVLSADPRLVPQARTLSRVSYSELRDLSFFGAKVLHPDTIKPAIDANIPVSIRNTFESDNPGTTAVHDNTTDKALARCVSVRSQCVCIKARVPVHSNGNEWYQKLLSIARNRSCEILLGTHTDTQVTIVVPAEHEHAFGEIAEGTRVDIICVTGPNLSLSDTFDSILKICTRYRPLCIVAGLTFTSTCAVVQPEYSIELLRELHACINEQVL